MTFASELDCYLAKMRAREPMVMYRFGDGELMLIDGVAVGPETQASRTDRWEAPAGQSRLGRDIATALATQEPWAHFGIPCPCCNLAGYERLKHLPNAFPANLFINANHKRFLNALPSLEEVALVSNERATFKGARMGGTLAVRWMPVPDNCVNFYEENREIVLGRARAFARDLPDRSLVLVAAGPLSEALLFFMWNEAPRHTYVDVGSALDEQLYGVKTRAYMIDGNPYATKECALPAPTSLRVSFIINTACGDPIVGPRQNPYRSLQYRDRARILAEEILPRAQDFDEVIVAGHFPDSLTEAFPAVRFVDVAAVHRDRWDALPQREAGARHATGDVLVFAHDDHAPGPGLADALRRFPAHADVLCPRRVHQKTGATLNSGRAEGYVGGHYVAMRRDVWARVPWTVAPHNDLWDTFLSAAWAQDGARIAWTDDVHFLDCEATETET